MNIFAIMALVVLALFYVVYFGKQLAQRRQGIQTRQLGRHKEVEIRRVEYLLALATGLLPIAQLLSIAMEWSMLPSALRYAGSAVGLAGDAVFIVAVVRMRDQWRAGLPEQAQTHLVTEGIYAYSRNPAFLGFDGMYVGVLLLYFNLLTFVLTAFAVTMLHQQILQEEKFLSAAFGKEYDDYRKRTARYMGFGKFAKKERKA